MWWEPTNDYERILAQDVRSVRSWLIESGVARELGCFGAGSIWSQSHEAFVPVILLPSSRGLHYDLLRPRNKSWLYRVADAVDRRTAFPSTNLPLHVAILKPPQATNASMSIATQITTDRIMDTFVRIREPILCSNTGKVGTAGVIAWNHKTPVLLTAGHIFSNTGSEVYQFRSRWPHISWLGSNFRFILGVVTHQRAPTVTSGPDWDVAVIQYRDYYRGWPDVPLVSKLYQRFQSAEKVRVCGAYSGLVTKAVVQGALTDLGVWKNCWMIAPSGVLRDGDSGAAVFVERDASFLGMYVAKSELPGTRLPLFHYVQDAFTLEKEVLSSWNITFNIGA